MTGYFCTRHDSVCYFNDWFNFSWFSSSYNRVSSSWKWAFPTSSSVLCIIKVLKLPKLNVSFVLCMALIPRLNAKRRFYWKCSFLSTWYSISRTWKSTNIKSIIKITKTIVLSKKIPFQITKYIPKIYCFCKKIQIWKNPHYLFFNLIDLDRCG